MSDLDLAKSKLIDTIGHYNATASNIQKFKFNQLETNVFASMMVEFAEELANGINKQDEKALSIQNVMQAKPEKKCGKPNCNRIKLDNSPLCSYHWDIANS